MGLTSALLILKLDGVRGGRAEYLRIFGSLWVTLRGLEKLQQIHERAFSIFAGERQ